MQMLEVKYWIQIYQISFWWFWWFLPLVSLFVFVFFVDSIVFLCFATPLARRHLWAVDYACANCANCESRFFLSNLHGESRLLRYLFKSTRVPPSRRGKCRLSHRCQCPRLWNLEETTSETLENDELEVFSVHFSQSQVGTTAKWAAICCCDSEWWPWKKQGKSKEKHKRKNDEVKSKEVKKKIQIHWEIRTRNRKSNKKGIMKLKKNEEGNIKIY